MMEIAFLVNGFDPEDDLENFDGKEKYSEPEFMWSNTSEAIGSQFLILIKVLYLQFLE